MTLSWAKEERTERVEEVRVGRVVMSWWMVVEKRGKKLRGGGGVSGGVGRGGGKRGGVIGFVGLGLLDGDIKAS